MDILKTILTILLAIDCIGLIVLVLLQEGKEGGLGGLAGASESYWGQNKGRSMEGALVKITRILAIVFVLLAVVLNLKVFA
ncbi:MAG: preprotein translocase subunit SecG [Tyzzerella sp.]|nr:preprotein translocase subunit SecG [Tyzzerella sp.]